MTAEYGIGMFFYGMTITFIGFFIAFLIINYNLNLTSKLQKILSANLITDNKSIDITKELNEYAGPMNNFYTDILEDNEICPVKYAFSNVNKIDIIDDCANTIELNDELKL